MTESEALARMIAPGRVRPGKPAGGVIQILITSSCDRACFGCTQASQLRRKPWFMPVGLFDAACRSLAGYFGTVGVFGGNPALHPQFEQICGVLRQHFPREQCGLWCNNPLTPEKARAMRATFSTARSNLNVHQDADAYRLFRDHWPEARPFGLHEDSRHSPPYVALRDVVADEGERWGLISGCDINKHWSAMIGLFRGELRAWFCEVAGAQSILHQDEPDYPDTGLDPVLTDEERDNYPHLTKVNDDLECPDCGGGGMDGRPLRNAGPCAGCGGKGWVPWWRLPMWRFARQVRKHCHDCGVPLRGRGELACAGDEGAEQVSATHAGVFLPKRPGRRVELVTLRSQLGDTVARATDYLGNARG